MKTGIRGYLLVIAALAAVSQAQEPLRLVQTITLPVKGKFDHMAVDVQNNRAFVAASGNSTLEVIDLQKAKWIHSIPGKGKPAGVWYCPSADRVVYSLDSGSLRILNPNTLEVESEVTLAEDADTLGWDAENGIVFVDAGGKGTGEPFSRLSPVVLKTRKNLGDIKIDSSSIEHMAFEDHGPRMFLSDKANGRVVVIDRRQRKVMDTWEISVAKQTVSMALNESEHRLYVGARQPGMLVVLDTETGKTVAHLPATGFTDDAAYDAVRKRIYLSGGDGFLDVYQELDPDHYVQAAKIPTREGARTSRWVPEQNRLYLEVPALKPRDAAEIRVFEAD